MSSDNNFPNELTTLKTAMQKDEAVARMESLEKKSQWIQVRMKTTHNRNEGLIKLLAMFSNKIIYL